MKGRKFGRKPAHRKALMINLCTSLIQHERITTTLRLIHKAKSGTPESNIILNAEIKNKAALNRLHNIIAPRFANLPAGFTRIEFTGKRRVDKSETAIIELIGND
jgi:large subunit ribosomal protein L17